jgi:signal transduction protein with GAF and PtsI domain
VPTSGKNCAELERQIEELKKQVSEAGGNTTTAVGGARKKSVKFAVEPEPTVISSTSTSDVESKIANLERALEDAAKERQEILEAAEREIEYHRSIAADLEQSLIEDFEWKLHEIEADFHKKLHEHDGDKAAPPQPLPTAPLKSRFR